jgi:hypothetical protein
MPANEAAAASASSEQPSRRDPGRSRGPRAWRGGRRRSAKTVLRRLRHKISRAERQQARDAGEHRRGRGYDYVRHGLRSRLCDISMCATQCLERSELPSNVRALIRIDPANVMVEIDEFSVTGCAFRNWRRAALCASRA